MNSKSGIVNIHGKDYMTVAKRVELWLADNKTNKDGYSIETEIVNHDPVVVKAVVKWKGNTFNGVSSVALGSLKQIEKQNPYEVAETSAVGRALGFAGYGLIDSIASVDEMYKAGAMTRLGPTQAPQNTTDASDDFSYVSDEESNHVVTAFNNVMTSDDVPTVQAAQTADPYKEKSLAALRIAVSQLMTSGKIAKDFSAIAKLTREDAIRILSEVTTAAVSTPVPDQESLPLPLSPVCATCGEPAEEKQGTSKSGKDYHGIFCSTGNKTHTRWLND